MSELNFDVELSWFESEGKGAGEIKADDLTFEISGPESMGGRGVGTNPEELLVCAVSSCYIATLFAVLGHDKLPVDSLALSASGAVTGFPGRARFARVTVSPTILGGDVTRQAEYESAAALAHDRCLIGNSLGPNVAYEVGAVQVRDEITAAASAAGERSSGENAVTCNEDDDEREPAWLSGS